MGQDLREPGPHEAGSVDVSVARSGGGSFTATLFYPATVPGAGAPFDPNGAPYAAVSFGHGFLQPVGQYASTLQHLATWGYFVIATQSQGGFTPSHSQFASDMRDCLTWLEMANGNTASPFHEQVDTAAFGLSGHSMGGGASILAAAADERVRALANLAPAETSPSAIAAMASVSAPTRLINGSEDGIVPVELHGQPMYDNGGPPKQLLIIAGGFHCGFTDEWFPFCDRGGITRCEQLATTRGALTSFFNLYLKDDQTLWNAVWGPTAGADPSIAVELDSGIVVSPENVLLEAPPGAVSATLTVANMDDTAASYTVLIEETEWGASAKPPGTDVLEPQQSQAIEVIVTVPSGPDPDSDSFFVTARHDGDNGTRGYAEVAVHRTSVGDIDGDGVVGVTDLLLLVTAWGDCRPPPEACPADLDGNGVVAVPDLVLLLVHWG